MFWLLQIIEIVNADKPVCTQFQHIKKLVTYLEINSHSDKKMVRPLVSIYLLLTVGTITKVYPDTETYR